MPGCAAVNCSNHSSKGYRLFIFPRDPKRRAKWLQNCRRENWIPTNSSRLCEHHFEPSEFEKNRADGIRKLKPNAVPTIFNVPNPPPPINSTKRILKEQTVVHMEGFTALSNSIGYVYLTNQCNDENGSEPIAVHIAVPTAIAVSTASTSSIGDVNLINPCADENTPEVFKELGKVKRALWRTQKQVRLLQQRIKHSREMLQKLPFLSKEMIEHLSSGRKKGPWAPSLIKKSLQIRSAVGWKGYKYLVKNHFPLPSYRTLCRHLSKLNFNPG